MRRVKCGVFIALFFTCQAIASWSLNIQYNPGDPGVGNDQFKIKVANWDQDDETSYPASGCSFRFGCYITIGFEDPGTIDYLDGAIEIPDVKTMGEAAKAFSNKGGLQHEFISKYIRYPGKTCFYLAYKDFYGSYKRMPGGSDDCPRAMIDPTFCRILEPSVELTHGDLTADKVTGNTASAEISATCNRPYRISVVAADKKGILDLGYGLKSELKVNGVDLGAGYVADLSSTPTTFTLTSTLSGHSSGEGVFEGATVVILGLP